MGLKGGYACLKYTMIVGNTIFLLAGICCLSIALWITFDKQFETELKGSYEGLYLLIAVGSLTTVVCFLGCCGSAKENPCMLMTYFSFLLIIVVLEIVAGVNASIKHQSEVPPEVGTSGLLIIVGVAFGFALLGLLGMIVSMMLFCAISKNP